MNEAPTPPLSGRSRLLSRIAVGIAILAAIYVVVSYVIVPAGWIRYAKRHPSFDNIPTITKTHSDIPGDPLNVALIGSETELKRLLLAAKWFPADPLTLRSCLEIAEASVLRRPYKDAPVSNLFLFGRKEDLAFEKPVGDNPRKRHHVRFWRSSTNDADGRPVWVGSATFDERVGLSHTTGQITHHIAPDLDAERDILFQDLRETSMLVETFSVADFQKTHAGKNGGGDPWRTDGSLLAGVIRSSEP